MTNYRYTIKQLPHEHDNTFMDSEWAMAHGGIRLEDYEPVFSGEVSGASPMAVLEKLFTRFNVGSKPDGYTGRSMSVSDVVELNTDAGYSGHWFCDSFGFLEIPEE